MADLVGKIKFKTLPVRPVGICYSESIEKKRWRRPPGLRGRGSFRASGAGASQQPAPRARMTTPFPRFDLTRADRPGHRGGARAGAGHRAGARASRRRRGPRAARRNRATRACRARSRRSAAVCCRCRWTSPGCGEIDARRRATRRRIFGRHRHPGQQCRHRAENLAERNEEDST